MFHLPDLPNVGYATTREKALSDNIQEFMRQIERDRIRLLTIVIEGKERWRKVAGDIWRGYRIGQEAGALDAIYDYLTLQACGPSIQVQLLDAKNNPATWRDLVKVAMPHLEAERETLKLMAKWQP